MFDGQQTCKWRRHSVVKVGSADAQTQNSSSIDLRDCVSLNLLQLCPGWTGAVAMRSCAHWRGCLSQACQRGYCPGFLEEPRLRERPMRQGLRRRSGVCEGDQRLRRKRHPGEAVLSGGLRVRLLAELPGSRDLLNLA